MSTTNRFGKPNMTNLPSELGKEIFKKILDTPRANYERIYQEATLIEKKIVEVREKEGIFLCRKKAKRSNL